MLIGGPLVVVPTPKLGVLPSLDVTFAASATTEYPAIITGYSWDFNGDGTEDLACTLSASTTASFQEPGLYNATVTVHDNANIAHTDTVIENVLDGNAYGDMFTQKWNDMKAALANGELEVAASYYAPNVKSVFSDQFAALKDNLSQVLADMTGFRFVKM